MSITSNLKQSEALVYFTGSIEHLYKNDWNTGSATFPEIGFPSISVITDELVSEIMFKALFLWWRKFIYFPLFYFSFVIDNAKPKCLHCVSSKIYSCILSLFKLRNILFYELDVLHIFDISIVCPYEICKFIWTLIW